MKKVKADPTFPRSPHIPGAKFTEVLYADDTVICANNNIKAKKILWLIIKYGKELGLRLNYDKCVHMPFHSKGRIPYPDDLGYVPKEDDIKYLGVNMNVKAEPQKELSSRIRETTVVWKRLGKFWKQGVVPAHKKIQYYNAILRAKLVYGMETLNMTQKMKNSLRVFHLKGLRQILKIKTTFINRHNTNERVFRWANQVYKNGKRPTPKRYEKQVKAKEDKKTVLSKRLDNDPILPLDTYVQKRATELLGHIIRGEVEDPMRQVIINMETGDPLKPDLNRVGRPRIWWLEDTWKFVWEHLKGDMGKEHENFSIKNTEHIHLLKAAAEGRYY